MIKLPSGTDMDVDDDNNRGRSTSSSRTTSRSAYVSSCAYHTRMEPNNDLPDDMAIDPIDSSQLSYKDDFESEGNPVSKATDPTPAKEPQRVKHDKPALNKAPKPRGKSASINNTNSCSLGGCSLGGCHQHSAAIWPQSTNGCWSMGRLFSFHFPSRLVRAPTVWLQMH